MHCKWGFHQEMVQVILVPVMCDELDMNSAKYIGFI